MLYFCDLKCDLKNLFEFLGEVCFGCDCINFLSVFLVYGSGLELKLMYRNVWNSVYNIVVNFNSIKILGVVFICYFYWLNVNVLIWLIIKLINNLVVRVFWLGD